MPSERDLIRQIQSQVTRLVQAVADARFWHDRWIEQADRAHQGQMDKIESQHQQILNEAKSVYETKLAKISEDNRTVINDLNQFAAPLVMHWDDSSWASWKPTTDDGNRQLIRIGQLSEKGQWHRTPLPALLPLIGCSNLLLKGSGATKAVAASNIQSLMLRLLASIPPSKLHFTLIDPVGLGQNVAVIGERLVKKIQ